jgi:hypothetical protein
MFFPKVRKVYVRTACETNTDFVHLHLGVTHLFLLVVGSAWLQEAPNRSVLRHSVHSLYVFRNNVDGHPGRAEILRQLVRGSGPEDLSSSWLMITRSLENQLNSTWNSYTAFVVDWALNIATDILRMCILRQPFELTE